MLHKEATVSGVLLAFPYARNVMETTLTLSKESKDRAASYVSGQINHMTYDELTAFGLVASASACAAHEFYAGTGAEHGIPD